jgi:preprotein translocase subunit SecD
LFIARDSRKDIGWASTDTWIILDEEAMSFAIALRAGALAAQVEVTELRELEHSARVSTDSASPETPQAPPLPSLP